MNFEQAYAKISYLFIDKRHSFQLAMDSEGEIVLSVYYGLSFEHDSSVDIFTGKTFEDVYNKLKESDCYR